MPIKTREIHNHHIDSTVWNDFEFRDDDIVIATYGKSGTTWVQQIVSQLLFEGAEELPVAEMSPWVDLRVPPKEVKLEALEALEAQTHRRFLKTHLPVDALVFSEKAKYIFIARDGRDVVWSFYIHHAKANALWYELINDTPGRVGPPIEPPCADVREYYLEWLEKDGFPLWPFWENIKSWWDVRHLDNVKLLHFSDLKRDPEGEIRGIAEFLGVAVREETWDDIFLHCTFDYMKQHATKSTPLGGAVWDEGAKVFINRGTNGRWAETLTEEDNRRYEERALAELGPECSSWLAAGKAAD